ncbi:MAG: calcium-binding protein [Cypionkella sp.]|nr:calcium-binding protein [Cypionkella sp.]
MLALLAIFGAVGAGLIADSLMRSPEAEDDSPPEGEEPAAEDDTSDQSVNLDWIEDEEAVQAEARPAGFVDDGMPVSDDIADPVDAPITAAGNAADNILNGGAAGDTLSGGAGHDQLTGRGGADRLAGGSGQDHLHGEEGDDTLLGQGGDDVLIGGAGNDILSGGRGADSLAGSEGDDAVSGGGGADTLMGGEGEDTLNGGMGRDWLVGGSGNDQMIGGGAQDSLDGGAGDDTLWGGAEGGSDAAIDLLNGGSGNDLIGVGAGDIAMGGDGTDTFQLQDYAPGLPVSEIVDYNPDEDDLVVVYDPAQHEAPSLTTEAVAGTEDVTLLLDGVAIALIRNAVDLDLSQITLRAA